MLSLLGGWGAVSAADRGAGATYYYPGASSPGPFSYGEAAPPPGIFRPADSAAGQWSGQGGAGAGFARSPYATDPANESTWGGPANAFRGDAGAGQGGRPAADYRFRPRPEDRSAKTDEGLRYRPDPDLARRSQQFWGVPGQDPALYGSGPAPVFRPLQPEREQAGRAAAGGGQVYGEPAPPAWSAYPMVPSAGYGYPY